MHSNQGDFENSGAFYHPFVERQPSQGKGMLAALSRNACVVVTDDYPCFEIPRWVSSGATQSEVLLEKIDSNGIFPMRSTERVFVTAHSFRRFLNKNLDNHLQSFPLHDPLDGVDLPAMRRPSILREAWAAAAPKELAAPDVLADQIPVDHSVRPTKSFTAGAGPARGRLRQFVRLKLARYADSHNQPEADVSSGLSVDLHFGHLSAHDVFEAVRRAGHGEAFLDQLVTWRELGFNLCSHTSNYDCFESLPVWAQKTLLDHAKDPRPIRYSGDQLERAATHDPLWNAAQNQLLREGRIHNYLRMLWGKKILEWSASPQESLETMIHLNNKYALDGRDPNSYSGIFWVLGRYDRPWGSRPIFGTIRYMSSESAARKLRVGDYIRRYSSNG